ncbi:hypothetical protein D3C77_658890 [compost metagenome]
MVVQMSVVATHPLLEKHRVRPASEQVAAMVGLDQQGIQALIAFQQSCVVGAKVGQHAETPASVVKHVLQWLKRVVGYAYGADA